MPKTSATAARKGGVKVSAPVQARGLEVGSGFSARAFRHDDFGGLMDPLIMVDDYTMTEPTFGAHPHAGIAAVSLLFEDSEGDFYNHDSLGNHLVLGAGDLYWLNAGRGAMHDESPQPGAARIRGLQIFVKLPAKLAAMAPSSNYIPAASIPVITAHGVRVRVVAGESHGKRGFVNTPVPVTMLDGYLDGGAMFAHWLNDGQSAWFYTVEGEITVSLHEEVHRLQAGQALSVRVEKAGDLQVSGVRRSHFALLSADPHDETFVHQGPFALASEEEIAQAQRDADDGLMGVVEYKPVTNA
ncbi:pirin family protein [Billgrantia azerbaijanica]|nr:pirin family protein [Halomonas azerbaijanica]